MIPIQLFDMKPLKKLSICFSLDIETETEERLGLGLDIKTEELQILKWKTFLFQFTQHFVV